MCSIIMVTFIVFFHTRSFASNSSNSEPTHVCNGVNIGYSIESIQSIPVNSTLYKYPYGFRAKIEIENLGSRNLLGWKIAVNFTRDELITSVTDCKVAQSLPYAGNFLIFESISGWSDRVITAINAAGDVNQYRKQAQLIGTAFFYSKTINSTYNSALPSTLQLVDKSEYTCNANNPKKWGNKVQVCCEEANLPPPPADSALIRDSAKADITIRFDIVTTYEYEYTTLVTIANNQKYRRVQPPGWNISWTWRANEIIWDMRGAEASMTGNCINSYAHTIFRDNVQQAHSCMTRPSISDLSIESYYKNSYQEKPDFTLLSCCKNGTLGAAGFPPRSGDPAMAEVLGNETISQFKMKVGTPMGGLNKITMPVDFDIGLPGFLCGGAYRVDPTTFPLTAGRRFNALDTWKIDCNRTVSSTSKKSCCVSYSSYYNKTEVDSGDIVPLVTGCKPCACGCTSAIPNSDITCSVNSKNQWAEYSPPCSDGCAFNVHWRVQNVYPGGWLANLIIYNREKDAVKDWFVAVTIPSLANASDIYSFQYVNHSGATTLMWGFKYTNDWILGSRSTKRMSNVQSVIRFGEMNGFNISNNGGIQAYPTRIVLNGEECEMPETFPTYDGTPKKKTFIDRYKNHLGVGLAGVACVALAYLLAKH